MNLWAKHGRQLLFAAVALFFFSCEDEITKTGFRNPTRKFEVFTVELDVPTSTMAIDSAYTESSINGGLLVGHVTDPQTGISDATAFFDYIAHAWSDTIALGGIYDSIVLDLRLNHYVYGYPNNRTETVTIHELTGNDFFDEITGRAFPNNSITYQPASIGSGSVNINLEKFADEREKSTAVQDTTWISTHLDNTFGLKLFNESRHTSDAIKALRRITPAPANLQSQLQRQHLAEFREVFKGLAVVAQDAGGAFGIRNDGLTRLRLHYHTVDNTTGLNKDTLQVTYTFSTSSFSNIQSDRSATPLAQLKPKYHSKILDKNYIHSGNPVVTKLDLSQLYQFIREDSVKDIVLNEVKLLVNDVAVEPGFAPHRTLAVKLLNNNDFFFNYRVGGERAQLANPAQYAIAAITSGADVNYGHYFVSSETSISAPLYMSFNENKKAYEGFMTTFVQQLMEIDKLLDITDEKRVRYLALAPAGQALSNQLDRTIFPTNAVKLKVYFTRPITNP